MNALFPLKNNKRGYVAPKDFAYAFIAFEIWSENFPRDNFETRNCCA